LLYLSDAEYSELKDHFGEKLFIEKEGAGTGAENFLRFFTQELISHIESHYQADKSDRTYVGYSGGSLFGLYVLGTSPETFNRYVLGSGLRRLGERLQQSKEFNVRLYVGVGLDEYFERPSPPYPEMIAGYYDLVSLLSRRHNIPGFEYHYQAFSDEVHGTACWLIFSTGLRWVFLGNCKPYLYPDGKCPADQWP
jgi:predicted alpha/beta superfamily hydrolase